MWLFTSLKSWKLYISVRWKLYISADWGNYLLCLMYVSLLFFQQQQPSGLCHPKRICTAPESTWKQVRNLCNNHTHLEVPSRLLTLGSKGSYELSQIRDIYLSPYSFLAYLSYLCCSTTFLSFLSLSGSEMSLCSWIYLRKREKKSNRTEFFLQMMNRTVLIHSLGLKLTFQEQLF